MVYKGQYSQFLKRICKVSVCAPHKFRQPAKVEGEQNMCSRWTEAL